jgi:hypothetical protein
MLFDTEFNGGHFKDNNVKIGSKLELLDWKRQKAKNPDFFEVCSGPNTTLTGNKAGCK